MGAEETTTPEKTLVLRQTDGPQRDLVVSMNEKGDVRVDGTLISDIVPALGLLAYAIGILSGTGNTADAHVSIGGNALEDRVEAVGLLRCGQVAVIQNENRRKMENKVKEMQKPRLVVPPGVAMARKAGK